MLEKQLSAILAHHLREFIENVNEEQLRISLWSGELVLHNLTLRPDVLDQVVKLVLTNTDVQGDPSADAAAAAAKSLLLPFTVVEGIVDTLRISVPWTALQGEPVSLILEGISLVLGPLRSRPYSQEEESNRSGVIRSQQLRFLDRLLTQPSANRGGASAPVVQNAAHTAGATTSVALITTIARNAHVVLRNVSLRYLHDYAGLHPSLKSMLELSIAEIFVSTTDEDWQARYVSDPQMPICKEISVEGLKARLFYGADSTADSVAAPWSRVDTLFHCEAATVRVKLPAPASAPGMGRPKIGVVVQCSPVSVGSALGAFRHVGIIAESLSSRYVDYSFYRSFLHFLDPAGRAEVSIARRRWVFACAAVLHACSRRKLVLQHAVSTDCGTLKQVTMHFCKLRREYISLFKRSKKVAWLPPLKDSECHRLEELELGFRVDQVVFVRCLAHAELAVERSAFARQQKLIRQRDNTMPSNNSKSGWSSWFRRSPPHDPVEKTGAEHDAHDEPPSDKNLFVDAFAEEWHRVRQFLNSESAPAAVSSKPSTAPSDTSAAAIALHVDIPSVTFFLVADASGSPFRTVAQDLLSALQQRVMVTFSDISIRAHLNDAESSRFCSVDVGRCLGHLSTSSDHSLPPRDIFLTSDLPAWEASVRPLALTSSAPPTPMHTSWMSVGITHHGDIDVTLRETCVVLMNVHILAMWGEAVAAASEELLAALAHSEVGSAPSPLGSSGSASTSVSASQPSKVHLSLLRSTAVLPCLPRRNATYTDAYMRLPAVTVDITTWPSGAAEVDVHCKSFEVDICLFQPRTQSPQSIPTWHRMPVLRVGECTAAWRGTGRATQLSVRLHEIVRCHLRAADISDVADVLRGVPAIQSLSCLHGAGFTELVRRWRQRALRVTGVADGGRQVQLSDKSTYASHELLASDENVLDWCVVLWLARDAPQEPPRAVVVCEEATHTVNVAVAGVEAGLVDLHGTTIATLVAAPASDAANANSPRAISSDASLTLSINQRTSPSRSSTDLTLSDTSICLQSLCCDTVHETSVVVVPCVALSARVEEQGCQAPSLTVEVSVSGVCEVAFGSHIVSVAEFAASVAGSFVSLMQPAAAVEPHMAASCVSDISVRFADTIRLELYAEANAALVSSGSSSLVSDPSVTEKAVCVVEVEMLQVSVSDTSQGQTVCVDGVIGSVQRVCWSSGELFVVSGSGTSRTQFSDQRFTVRLSTPLGDVAGHALPVTTVTGHLRGGRVCVYAGFLQKLAGYATESYVSALANAASSRTGRIGFCSLDDSAADAVMTSVFAAAAAPAPPPTLMFEVDNIEVLLPTDVEQGVSEDDADSFVYFHVDRVGITSTQHTHDSAKQQKYTRTSVNISKISAVHGAPSRSHLQPTLDHDSELYELASGVDIVISSHVLCLYDGKANGYAYKFGRSDQDGTTQVSIGQAHKGGSVDLTLTARQWTLLLKAVLRNLMVVPLQDKTVAVPHTVIPAAAWTQILMLTIPKVRLTISSDDHRTFVLRADPVRLYQVSNSDVATPQIALDLASIVIEETSSSLPVFERGALRSVQQHAYHSAPALRSRKLMVVDHCAVRTDAGDASTIPITTVHVQSILLQPFVSSFFALRDTLVDDALVSESLSQQSPGSSAESKLVLQIDQTQIALVEPWGEVLGEVVVQKCSIDVHTSSDGSQCIDVAVRNALTVRHTFLDHCHDASPYKYHYVLAGGKRNGAAHEGSHVPLAIKVHLPVLAPEVAASPGQHVNSVALRTVSSISIELHDIACVLLPVPLQRILQLLSGELSFLSSISYGPRQRELLLTTPCFDVTSVAVSAVNISVTIPCSLVCEPQDVLKCSEVSTLAPQNDHFEMIIARASVANEQCFSEATVHVNTRSAKSSVHQLLPVSGVLSCALDEYTVAIEKIEVRHAQQQPDDLPLVAVRSLKVVSGAPLPLSTVSMVTRSTAIARSESFATTQFWIIPPHTVMHRTSNVLTFMAPTSISVTDAIFHIDEKSICDILRTASVVGTTAAEIPYYQDLPEYSYSSNVTVCASNVAVSVWTSSGEDAPNLRLVGSQQTRDMLCSRTRKLVSLTAGCLKVAQSQSSASCAEDTEQQTVVTVESTGSILVADSASNVIVLVEPPSAVVVRNAWIAYTSKNSGDEMSVETCGLSIVLQTPAVDLAVELQVFVEKLLPRLSQNSQAKSSSAATLPAGRAFKVTVHMLDSSLFVTDVAKAVLRKVALVVGNDAPSTSPPAPTPQAVSFEGFELYATSKRLVTRPFAELGSVDLRVAPGELQVRLHKSRIVNYETAFFIELLDALLHLQDYVAINAKLPSQEEEGYRQSTLIAFKDVQIALFGHEASSVSYDQQPRLDFVFPGFVIRQCGTNASASTAVDTEDGHITYEAHSASVRVCRGLALSLQMESSEKPGTSSSATAIKLGPIAVVVPIGSVLQNCVEVAAATIFPFTQVVLFPDAQPQARAHHSHNRQAKIAEHNTITLTAPLLSLQVCDAASASGVEAATFIRQPNTHVQRVLFGAEVMKVHFSHVLSPESDLAEVTVMEIASEVDRALQQHFVSARPLTVDGDVLPAIVVRRDTKVRSGSHAPQQLSTDFASETSSCAESQPLDTSRQRVTTVEAKLYDVEFTVSPLLLAMVNENILERVAFATKRAKDAYRRSTGPVLLTPKRKPMLHKVNSRSSLPNSSSPDRRPMSDAASVDGGLRIPHPVVRVAGCVEYILRTDLVLGGAQGSVLHFSKFADGVGGATLGGHNTILFRAPVGSVATVYVSDVVSPVDGLQYRPIVVDDGISVYCESVRFVLAPAENSAKGTVMDFIHLGERSVFHVEPSLVILPATTSPAAAILESISAHDTAGIAGLTRHHAAAHHSASSSSTLRVDLFARVLIRLFSHQQSVSLAAEVSGNYFKQTAQVRSGSAATHVVDERGDVAVVDVNIVSDSGRITTKPTGVVVHVAHHKPQESGDDARPRTSLRIILPVTRCVISVGHAKLIFDIVQALRKGGEHIGAIDLLAGPATAGGDDDTHSIIQPITACVLETKGCSPAQLQRSSASLSVPAAFPSHPSRRRAADFSRRTERVGAASADHDDVEVGATIPELTLTVTDDFFHPIANATVQSIGVRGLVSRDGRSTKLDVSAEIELLDFPQIVATKQSSTLSRDFSNAKLPWSHPPRLLLQTSVEVALVLNIFDCTGGGTTCQSVQFAVATPEVRVTAPLLTLIQVLHFDFERQKTGAHSFRNCTGVPLVVAPADRHIYMVQSSSGVCALPCDVVVKADIFKYDQTHFIIADGTPQSVEGKNLVAIGEQVDLQDLHAGTTLGLQFLAKQSPYPRTLTNIMLRLDPKEKIVTLSSIVTFRNLLGQLPIALSSDEEQFFVEPGESFSVPIPVLQHTMNLCVDGRWRLHTNPAAMAGCLQWDTLLGAFLATADDPVCEGDKRATSSMLLGAAEFAANGTLRIPLRLCDTSLDADPSAREISVVLTLQRIQLHRFKCASSGRAAAFEIVVAVLPVARFCNDLGVSARLTLGSRSLVIPRATSADWLDMIRDAPGVTPAQPTIDCALQILDGQRVVLESVETSALVIAPSSDQWIALHDAEKKSVYIRIHLNADGDTFELSAAGIIVNHLPLPVEILQTHGNEALLPGLTRDAVLDASSDRSLGHRLGDDDARALVGLTRPRIENVSVKVRLSRAGVRPSRPLSCSAVTLASALSCDEGHLVHVFSARREILSGATLLRSPIIHLEPLWYLRNSQKSMVLFVRSVGLDEHVTVVPPESEHPLMTFHASSSRDPAVQVAFGSSEGRLMFAWSAPLPLATLTSAGAACVLRHLVRDDASETLSRVDAPVYESFARKPSVAKQVFCCLSLAARRLPQGSVVVECKLSSSEVVIENRTSSNVAYHLSNAPCAEYSIAPYSNAAVADEVYHAAPPTIVLAVQDPKKKSKFHSVTIDLLSECSKREGAAQIVPELFVHCSLCVVKRTYFVTLTQDRHLEGSLVQQSANMSNFEFFCRRLVVHVAAPLVNQQSSSASFAHHPLSHAALCDQLQCVSGAALKTIDAACLVLQSAELDVFAIDLETAYVNICSNGLQSFGDASFYSLRVWDCCSQRKPVFPVVFSVTGTPSAPDVTKSNAAVRVKAHVGEPASVEYSGHKTTIIAVPLLSVQCQLMHVNLSDAFLFSVRHVAEGLVRRWVPESSPSITSEAAPQETSFKILGKTQCYIQRLLITPVDIRLSLTRRSDGLYNPFSGIPLGVFIPSLESAPIRLGEFLKADVQCFGESALSAVLSLMVPVYRNQILMQVFSVIGAAEALGNPVMLASEVAAGVRAFVRETADLHPWQGVKSLLQSTTCSALHSVALLSKVTGTATAMMSADFDWLAHRESYAVQSAPTGWGILRGVVSGVSNGVVGVIRDPVAGYAANGAAGFCTGLITGTIGVFSRPVTGVLDGLGASAQSISTSLKAPATGNQEAAAHSADDPVRCRNFVSSDAGSDSNGSRSVSAATSPRGESCPSRGLCITVASNEQQVESRQAFTNVIIASTSTAHSETERWRGLVQTYGAATVARHSPWKEYHRYATAYEFAATLFLVAESIVAHELSLLRRLGPVEYRKVSASMSERHSVDLQRAANIKSSLGAQDMLKFVSLDQFVEVCCLSELLVAASHEELHKKIAAPLREHVERAARQLLLQLS